MENLRFADEVVKGAVVSICEGSVDMRVILEEEEVELNFGFDVCCFVDDLVDRFYFGGN